MESTGRPTLVLRGGSSQEMAAPLGPITTLGRESDNDIVLAEPGVSRHHAEIVETEKGFQLRDLGSSNGTFVNRKDIGTGYYVLKDGDGVQLVAGSKPLVFRESGAGAGKPRQAEPVHSAAQPASPTLTAPTAPPARVPDLLDRPVLLTQGGSDHGKLVPLGSTTTMGLDPDNDLVILEPQVSRNHAEIVRTDQGYYVRDLSSTNGTFVNRQQVMEEDHLLKDGDRVQLGTGESTLVFRLSASAAAEAPPIEPPPMEPAAAQPTLAQPPVEKVPLLPAEKEEVVGAPSPPTGVVRAIGEPEPIEAVAAEQPKSTLAAVLQRLGLGRGLKLRGEAEEELEPLLAALPPLVRLKRAVRNVREAIGLKFRPRTLTLSLESGIVRAVMLQGREVVAWGIADPRDVGAPDDGPSGDEIGEGREGDISRIRSLLAALRAQPARLVTNLPLYTPLVRHIRLPVIRRRYINDVVTSEVFGSIPFSRDEVDIKWRLLDGDDSRNVMAIAVRKPVIDAHVEVVKAAGAAPAATYSEAMALSVAAGVPDAMVVQLGPSQVAMVLVRGGVPRAVHQLAAPGGDQSPEELVDAIARAVEQMEGFDQTIGPGEEQDSLPLLLTGEERGQGALLEVLRSALQRKVLPFSPPLEWPDEFPMAEYATNAGLALLDQVRPKWWRPAPETGSASLNLLSARHLPRQVPFIPLAVFLVIGLLAVTGFNLTPKVDEKVSQAASSAELAEKKKDEARIRRIETGITRRLENEARDIQELTLEMESRLAELQDEMGTLGNWFGIIEVIVEITANSRVTDVTLPSLTPKADQFQLSGTARSLSDVTDYADSIRDTGLFIEVEIRQVGASGGLSLGSLEDSVIEESETPVGADIEAKLGEPGIKFLIQATLRIAGQATEESAEPGA